MPWYFTPVFNWKTLSGSESRLALVRLIMSNPVLSGKVSRDCGELGELKRAAFSLCNELLRRSEAEPDAFHSSQLIQNALLETVTRLTIRRHLELMLADPSCEEEAEFVQGTVHYPARYLVARILADEIEFFYHGEWFKEAWAEFYEQLEHLSAERARAGQQVKGQRPVVVCADEHFPRLDVWPCTSQGRSGTHRMSFYRRDGSYFSDSFAVTDFQFVASPSTLKGERIFYVHTSDLEGIKKGVY